MKLSQFGAARNFYMKKLWKESAHQFKEASKILCNQFMQLRDSPTNRHIECYRLSPVNNFKQS